MGTCDQIDIVDVIEFGSDLGSEEPASASRRHGPGLNVLRVGPHQVAEGALVGDLHSSVDESDLVDGLDLWGQSAMDTEHLALDNGSDSEIVEDFGAVFPWVSIAILPDSLIVEAVDSGDLPSLVVSSQEGDMSWVLHLEAEEQLESFDGIETSINKISHEDVSGVWNFTAFVE